MRKFFYGWNKEPIRKGIISAGIKAEEEADNVAEEIYNRFENQIRRDPHSFPAVIESTIVYARNVNGEAE